MGIALVLLGTQKGLFLITSTDGWATWSVGPQLLGMQAVYGVAVDTRGDQPRLFASTHSQHWGPAVAWSDDLGATWSEVREAPVAFPSDVGASVERVWQIQPGPPNQPGVVWAGTEPAALFRSTDGGTSYELVRSLWDHPHRAAWMPGAGGQAVHTVLPHPDDPQRMLIAISAGGAYATADGGATWAPCNTGIEAEFFPDNRFPEFGQCVHKMDRSPLDPDQVFLQNHGGVYRSADGGGSWSSIGAGLPATFGFPVVAHPSRPGTAYVFPLDGSYHRNTPGADCAVYRTTDAGQSWEPLTKGLPQAGFYSVVLRDAFSSDGGDPLGLYLGTRSGEVYGSADAGDSWTQLAAHLPDVLSVRAAVLT